MSIWTLFHAFLNPDTTKAMIAAGNNEIGQNIYVVLVINLIIWAGIFFFLFTLDQKVKKLSEKMRTLTQKK